MSSSTSHSKRKPLHTTRRSESPSHSSSSTSHTGSKRINGSDIVKEMRRCDSRKMETAVLFFHPNIVTRPESVSFIATADNTIRRFLEIRCRLFDHLRQQLDATWDQVDDGHYTLDMDKNDTTLDNSITTTDALIQHMLACTHPYCLERPNMTCHPIKRFLYEPLLKLFYDDDHHHELAVFPKLFRTLHSHHFYSSTSDMQPLCERLCHWMSMMMGDFHGAETAAYTQKILPVLRPGGLPNIPSLAQLANAKVMIRVLNQDADEAATPGDGGIHVDDHKGVGVRRISLYDLRYSYSDFRQNDIPHTENAYELAFSTSMVKLARLIPDEPSFKLACRHEILVTDELLIDFQWWRDNILRNAEYYERESPYFWPIEQLRKTLDHLNELYASKLTGAPSLLKGHVHGIDKEAVLFFHPNANTHRDALSWSTLEICAHKQRCDPIVLLCYQRRHDLAELYDHIENTMRDFNKNNNDSSHLVTISVTDLVQYAEGDSTRLNHQLEHCSTFPIKSFMKLLSTYPTRGLCILETIGHRLKMQHLEPTYCTQLHTIVRHLVGDFFGTVPANYAFDLGQWDATHGSSTHRNSLYALASPVDHVPSLHQLVNQGGFTIVPCDKPVDGGIQVQDNNTIHIQRVNLLDIRFTEHSFSSTKNEHSTPSSLEGYFADAMLKLAILIPDSASFTLATTCGIIREMLFIDWPWWEAHVIRLRLFYSSRYTIGWETYRVLQDLKRAYMKRKKSIASQWPLQTALDALDASSKLAVRFFHPDPSDICIPSSMASAGMATDPTQHARILFEQRQIDLHDLLHTIDLNDSYWKNSTSRDTKEGFSFIIDQVCLGSTIGSSTTTVLQQNWKRYDIEPILILFLDRAPYSKLCRIRRWMNEKSVLAENLDYFDQMVRVLSGNLYSTLPYDWITTCRPASTSKGDGPSTNNEMRIINQQQQWMPSLDEWSKAGFRIHSEQRIEPHGVAIDIRIQALCVQSVSLLDIRYTMQHFQDDSGIYNTADKQAKWYEEEDNTFFEQCFADCMFKLSALVPDPRSFTIAVDTGVIPASLMIDWPWWRHHVLATAQHCASYQSPGHATEELFSKMRKEYRRYLHPTKVEKWTRYIRRHPRHVACALILVILLILVLIQTARGYHA
ncbi:hypothetical protein K492DRAFT_190439 [Lichtheimia hyalospora FSU 10163]|nr:hypothetical protein K492DRAFT_190439 [Lichtheimia hyalospora FSU 10163]